MLRLAVPALALLIGSPAAAAAAAPTLPPTGTDVDYQLGGNAALPGHVGIVVRDRKARPHPRAYTVCYVNAFQTQPDERRVWKRHPRLILRKDGTPVVDGAWNERLLDFRTRSKRRALVRIVGRWLDRCADDGFEAAELDNLDSFSRSTGLIGTRQTRRYAAALVRRAHAAGLAVAQKNRARWDGTKVGFDFAIAEECGRWRECGDYVDHYGDLVLAVEYRARDFRWTCARYGDRLAVVRRDRELTPGGIRRWC